MFKDTDVARNLSVVKLLGTNRDVMHAEMVEIQYDYLRLHQQCWRLLRFVKDKCHNDLIKIFGPKYITKESELRFIVGYVMMSAASTQGVGNLLKARLPGVQVSSKVMQDATDVVRNMIESGNGSLIVDHVLPKALGVRIDIEVEADD